MSNIFVLFWLGVLPLVNWPGTIDSEFPKFIVILFSVNVWGLILLINSKANIFKVNNQIDKLITFTGIVSSVSWLINGMTSEGLIGLMYRYQGLLTIWTFIELYFIAKNIIDWNKSSYLVNFIIRALAIVYLLGNKSLMGNSNFFGAYMAMMSSFVLIKNVKESEGKIISGILIWLTSSRSAALAWITNILLRIPKRWLVIAAIMVGLVIIIFPKKQVSSFDNRWNIWDKSTQLIIKKPILGWGNENYEIGFKSVLNNKDFDLKNIRVDRSHNIILDILANNGLVGLSVWTWLIILLFKYSTEFKYPLISFLVVGSLNVISLNAWVLFYLLAAMISNTTKENIF